MPLLLLAIFLWKYWGEMKVKWRCVMVIVLFIILTFVFLFFNQPPFDQGEIFTAEGKPKQVGKVKDITQHQHEEHKSEFHKLIGDFKNYTANITFANTDYKVIPIPNVDNNFRKGQSTGTFFESFPPVVALKEDGKKSKYQHEKIKFAGKIMSRMVRAEIGESAVPVGAYSTRNSTKMLPIPYLKNYKNPCWYEIDKETNKVHLRCVPYILVVGYQKAGTTEIHNKLSLHPQVAKPNIKEPFYWGKADKRLSLEKYSNVFSAAAFKILSTIQLDNATSSWIHPLVTFEATPTTIFEIPKLPGQKEPFHQPLHDIRKVIPQAKIIVTFRNPIDRLYSEYMRIDPNSTHTFHRVIENGIKAFNDCLQKLSLRKCVYWPQEYLQNQTSLELEWAIIKLGQSIYYATMQDLMAIFPRKQIHILRIEDYAKSKLGTLGKLYNFLELDPMDEGLKRKLYSDPIPNPGRYSIGGMKEETRKMLFDFFKPYNKKLATLLDNYTLLYNKFL